MLLSHRTKISLNNDYSNIIGHMCYAAYKLWNVGNYERLNYKELGLSEYPDWYYQKKYHKDDMWYKQLPSQTAQEVLKLLDKSWKSFYVLQKTHGIENPRPPRFKQAPIVITYMQNAIVHEKGSDVVRLSLPKQLKIFMSETYGISDNYIYLKNKVFKDTDTIKQIKIYPPEGDKCDIIVVYEVEDIMPIPDNGRYLSIDLGLHNLMTCYDSTNGDTFIVGRKYLSICNYFNKEIARVQSQWSSLQSGKGIKYPKSSKHIQQIHKKKNNSINDYLHKVTRYIVSYCVENHINTVVIGDITNIRKDNDLGNVTNQKLHSLPFAKIYMMLQYKLKMKGIILIKQNEAYTSQTSPLSREVSKESAQKSNRIKRGLYKDGDKSWNADCVGAYNILKLHLSAKKINVELNPNEVKNPFVAKVAV